MKIINNLKTLGLAAVVATMVAPQGTMAQEATTKLELSKAQVRIAQDNIRLFERIVGGLQANLFRGRGANFSAFNLDLDTYIHFNKSPLPNNPNSLTFVISSRGDQIINGVPAWAIQGFVEAYSTEVFKIDGVETNLLPQSNIYYMIESPQGYRERMQRWDEVLKKRKRYQNYIRESNEKDDEEKLLQASGRIIGVVTYVGIKDLTVEFYQVVPGTNELVRSGVFSGHATRAF